MLVSQLQLVQRRVVALSLFVTVFLAACGGGGGGGGSPPPPPPPPPVITVQPANASVQDATNVTFSVTATGTSLQYQWRKSGVNLAGATAATYTTNVGYSDNNTQYTVVVSNPGGSVTSNGATLTVIPIPVTITAQPQSATIPDGGIAMLSVTSTGTAPLQYQWRRAAANIAGATGSSYATPALALSDNGADYSVLVSNPAGAVTSANAIVSVTPVAPTIVQAPRATTTSDGGTVQFSVVASGSAPLSYEWRRNGVTIAGANTATYSITAAFADNASSYNVVVSNVAGSAVSSGAVLTVNPLAPSITLQPQAQSVAPGSSVSFSTSATGTAPIAYQWQRSIDNGATWSNIGGATLPTLAFTATFADFNARYRASITNPAATVNSLAATLQVRADLKLLSGALGGGGYLDGPGADVRLGTSFSVTAAPSGDIFFGDFTTVRRVAAGGQVSTFVGKFNSGGFVDGTGTAARITWPFAQAVDAAGNVYTTDIAFIRRVTPAGVTSTVAGAYFLSGSVDGPSAVARFGAAMHGLAVDAAGNIYVCDSDNHTIRVISAAGVVSTLAGAAGQAGSADGTGSVARFNNPRGIAIEANGNLIVADTTNHTIRRVTPAGVVTTVAGTAGAFGMVNAVGTDARFGTPSGVAVDPDQNIYVADAGNHMIRRIAPSGNVIAIAGNASQGFADGPGPLARFRQPNGIAYSAAGHLVVFDTFNYAVRRVTLVGEVTTVAGRPPEEGSTDGPMAAARYKGPSRMALGADGTIYIADRLNFVIRALTPSGTVSTLAGLPGLPGNNDGTGSAARFSSIEGIAVDGAGVVYVTSNQTIRRIALGGVVTTIAGTAGVQGFLDGAGSAARFFNPEDVAVDSAGNVYVADANNHTIRRVTPAGVVSTLAGSAGISGAADGAGTTARFNLPHGLTFDNAGNLFVADIGNHAIRKVTPAGDVTTYAGGLTSPGYNDDVAPLARFYGPYDLAFDSQGHLYVTELGNSVVRRVSSTGRVDTIIGELDKRSVRLGQQGLLNQPAGIVVLTNGRLVIVSENAILGD